MTALTRYDAACKALADAKRIDEVKKIRDQAEAMRLYGRMAKNRDLEIDAAEIRLRAERRLGEVIAGQWQAVGKASGRPKISSDAELISKPTLAEAGIDKKLSSRAQKLAAVPEAEFEGMLGDWRQRVSAENERVTTALIVAGDKAQRRAERERELAERQTSLPDRRFGVILADPEWDFEVYSRETGMDRHAANHYPTSSVEIIAARPVATIAADDSVLFLWVTVPHLVFGLAVMGAWGFLYKSHFCWAKTKLGTGYWNRNKHELLLVGTRGDIPAPAPGTQWDSLIVAPVGRHSQKPAVFYELIESYFPNLPKIELNARGPARPGWSAWGNEAEEPKDVRPRFKQNQEPAADGLDIPTFLRRGRDAEIAADEVLDKHRRGAAA